MTETYLVEGRRSNGAERHSSSLLRIEATATYSGYRQFTVDTKTIIR